MGTHDRSPHGQRLSLVVSHRTGPHKYQSILSHLTPDVSKSPLSQAILEQLLRERGVLWKMEFLLKETMGSSVRRTCIRQSVHQRGFSSDKALKKGQLDSWCFHVVNAQKSSRNFSDCIWSSQFWFRVWLHHENSVAAYEPQDSNFTHLTTKRICSLVWELKGSRASRKGPVGKAPFPVLPMKAAKQTPSFLTQFRSKRRIDYHTRLLCCQDNDDEDDG